MGKAWANPDRGSITMRLDYNEVPSTLGCAGTATPPKPAVAEPVVRLYRNVVERLNREVTRAFESARPQGVEVGGLLLGTVNPHPPRIEVEDFEPLSWEKQSDGRFLLSDSELERLENALEHRGGTADGLRRVVGCYRSNIGPALNLGVDDFALAQVCLHDSGGLFLLIRPAAEGSLKAGFFFWQDGHIDSAFSFHECPFDTQPPAAARPPHPSSLQQAAHAELPGAVLFGDRPGSSVNAPPQPSLGEKHLEPSDVPAWPGLAFGLPPTKAEVWRDEVLGRLVALLKWTRAIPWRMRAHELWKAVVARPVYPILAVSIVAVCMLAYVVWPSFRNSRQTAGGAGLEINVGRPEDNLRVKWNQNAPMVQRAQGAVLTIRDGDLPPVEVEIEPEQLRTGSIVYSPKSASVQFSLEIIALNGVKTTESVLAIASQRSGDPKPMTASIKPRAAGHAGRDRNNLPPLKSERDREKSVRVAPAHSPLRSASAQPRASARDGKSFNPSASGSDFGQQAPFVVVDPPAQAASVPPQAFPLIEQLAVAQATLAPLPLPEPQRSEITSREPPRLPVPIPFAAARPIHKSLPNLSSEIRATVVSEVEVQVKVKVDESGRVVKIEPVRWSGPASGSLVSASEDAAGLWRFAPAMRGDRPVPSEMLLKFVYRPNTGGN